MSDFQNMKKVTVRKSHRCCLCNRKIPKGFSAVHYSGKYEGEFFNVYYCNTCNTIATDFPEAVTDYDGYNSDWIFEETMSDYDCATPLQLLNKLRSTRECTNKLKDNLDNDEYLDNFLDKTKNINKAMKKDYQDFLRKNA